MTSPETTELKEAGAELLKSLRCLALEVPAEVWGDHAAKVNRYLKVVAEALEMKEKRQRRL